MAYATSCWSPDRCSTIPISTSTVDVAIIDTTTRMGMVSSSTYLAPAAHYPALSIPGPPTPSYSFLITHSPSNTKVVFDLGLRTDWKTATSPAIVRWIRDNDVQVNVDKDVATILQENGVDPNEIDAVVFSHHHFDHTGDPRRFSKHLKIVVGPGYKKQYLPGWPADRKGWETTSDLYHDRDVVEISFAEGQEGVLAIGHFKTYDYFRDGSFYLLNTPGHTVGHLSALARTTAASEKEEESTFILLGGDVAHNCALFRPSCGCPLPDGTELEAYARLHREYSEDDNGFRARTTPFCTATGPHHDLDAAQQSIDALATFDEMENVFTVLAHDISLEGVIEVFPRSAAAWKRGGWRERCRWRFLDRLKEGELETGTKSRL